MNFFKKLFGKKQEIEFSLPVSINEQDTIGVRDSIVKSRSFFEKQVERKKGYLKQNTVEVMQYPILLLIVHL